MGDFAEAVAVSKDTGEDKCPSSIQHTDSD